MKKKYSSVNDFRYLGRRFLKKDLAKNLGISKTTLYRYEKGYRLAPQHILDKIKNLRYSAPKKPTKKTSIKRKRYKKIQKKISKKYVEVDKKITQHSIVTIFEYSGDLKDIAYYINEISKNDISDNVVYQVIKIKYKGDKKIFDSTYNYHVDSIIKLIDNFKRILSKYASGLIDETQTEKIMIKRTEYI